MKTSRRYVSSALLLLTMISGCTEPQVKLSHTDLAEQLKQLNWFSYSIVPQTPMQNQIEGSLELPFTEAYLKKRHELLQRADLDSFAETAVQEAQYLSIQQRYPERFLPWPVHLNVPVVAQGQLVPPSQVDTWYGYVEARLNEARESKIVLNRIERQQLLDYLTPDITTQSKAAQRLAEYLASYRVRSSLGIYQLPNGKEWYQSKLNFYSGSVKPPEALLGELQSLASEYGEGVTLVDFNLNQPLVHQLLAGCSTRAGLNWRDGFVSLQQTASQCDQVLANSERLFALAMMEVDLGVHYFAWSQKQALLALQSRLALNEDQAFVVLKDILFFPATSFALLSRITSA
ncbi:hypothetical protein C3B51_17125 [Pseudoalteromonas rubra]|uniref:DUF885 domain-containing protein n=1 Tax=Pseudoalteromonas rubra TaxID=43658 RepID=A0A4Q7E4B7_9GAMM|nr:hypothetical protein [Pseudoalteromonas rubra]RZM77103.1 hypothetical protein C3B51_17125 [Pseudoalteromonas rubra]